MKKYLDILRLKEIIGKAGFFMVGVMFAKPAISLENFLITVQFFGVCLLNGIAVYLINAGLGYQQDQNNERLHELHSVKRTVILRAGYFLVVVSLAWLYFFSAKLLLPAIAIYVIWILYSLPNGLKGIPFFGLVCAFLAQILHFHIGYLVFCDWSMNSILLSVYFSLLFAAGHALHEVIDYHADQKAGLRTSAVFLGKENVFRISNYIFISAAIYLIMLAGMGTMRWIFITPYLVAFIVQMWFLFLLNANWSNDELFEFRRRYMLAYMLATVVYLLIIY